MNPSEAKPRPKWLGLLTLFRRLLIGAGVFLILLAIGIYLSRDWLKKEAREFVNAQLENSGIHLSYASLDYSPLRGAVLKGVTLYRTAERKEPVIELDNVGIAVGLRKLISEKLVDAKITVDSGTLVLFHGDPVAEFEDLDLKAHYENEKYGLTIDSLTTLVNGISLNVDGEYLFAKSKETPKSKEEEPASEGPKDLDLDFSFFQGLAEWGTFASEEEPPELKVTFLIDESGEGAVVKAGGGLSGKNVTWRGARLDEVKIPFSYDAELAMVEAEDFLLVFQGKPLSGTLDYYGQEGRIELRDVTSSVDPLALYAAFDFTPAEVPGGITFTEPPAFGLKGRLLTDNFPDSSLSIDFKGDRAVSFRLGDGNTFRLESLKGPVLMEKQVISTTGLEAKVMDGEVFLSGEAHALAKTPSYSGNLRLNGLSLAEVVAMGGTPDTRTEGRLHGNLNYEVADSIKSLRGDGNVRVTGANFYSIPVFKSLFSLLSSVVPIFGEPKEQELTANYVIKQGVIHTDDLKVSSQFTVVEAAGSFDLSDNTTEFNAQARVKGAVGLATNVVSRLLEVEGGGKIPGGVKWNMKNLSATGAVDVAGETASELSRTATGAAGQTLKTGTEGLKKASGGAAKVGEAGAEKVGKGLERLGQGLENLVPGKKK